MKSTVPLDILHEVGAVITDSHIVYTSGKHGSAYVNKDAVYPHLEPTRILCRHIAEHFVLLVPDLHAVIAPAIGGVVLTQWVAFELQNLMQKPILAVYAEKASDGSFVVARGYDKLIADKDVLVLEDVLTTGGSAKAVVDCTRACRSNVVGLGVICNRGNITAQDVGVPELFALTEIPLQAWEARDCPLCSAGVPINTQVGKGREFLSHQKT